MRELFVLNKKIRETARARTQEPLMETAKVGDLSTLKQIARERTQEPLKNQLKGGEFRRSGRKTSGRRRRTRIRKKVKYRKRSWWKKCKERIARFLTAKRNEEEKETKGRKSDKRPRTRQFLGKSGRLLFLLVLLAQNWLYVNAAAEGLQKRTEILERWQQQRFQAKEGRWVEEIPQRWKQPTGEDSTEMKKEARVLRWTLLNGSAWSTETKYMIKCKGKCVIFFGIEHRLRKEEMEEKFNKEVKEGWRFAADAARKTDETAGSEDRKHTSGGVFVTVDSNLGAVVGAGRLSRSRAMKAESPKQCVFSVYFWRSEGWTPRYEALLEAVLKQARTTRHPWLIPRDATM